MRTDRLGENMNSIEILELLYRWEDCGKKITGNGTILICHVPHVAPEAWLHEIYPPLTEENILKVEKALQKSFPTELKQFYTLANGINIFSDSLSIWGQRDSYERERENASLPYDIVFLNEENNCYCPKDWIYFGSYSLDGSQMVVNLSSNKNTIFRVKNGSTEILNEWPSFSEWLSSEINRLAMFFDTKGKELNLEIPNTHHSKD